MGTRDGVPVGASGPGPRPGTAGDVPRRRRWSSGPFPGTRDGVRDGKGGTLPPRFRMAPPVLARSPRAASWRSLKTGASQIGTPVPIYQRPSLRAWPKVDRADHAGGDGPAIRHRAPATESTMVAAGRGPL